MVTIKREIAISEILILVIAIFSFAYLLGSEIKIVSALENGVYTGNGQTYYYDGNNLWAKIGNAWIKQQDVSNFENAVNIGEMYQIDKSISNPIDSELGIVSTIGPLASLASPIPTKFNINTAKLVPKAPAYEWTLKDSIKLVDEAGYEFPLNKINIIDNKQIFADIGGTRTDITSKVRELKPEWFNKDGTLKSDVAERSATLSKSDTGTVIGDWLLKTGAGSGAANFFGHLASGIGWAATVAGIVKLVGSFATDNDAAVNAATAAAFGGIVAGKATYGLFKEGGWLQGLGKTGWGPGAHPGMWSFGAGLVTAAIIFYMMYEKTNEKIVTFECEPWDAPTGGANCEKCNNQELPCSIYQCKSLGQACNIVNDEKDGRAKCVWVNRKDVNPPIIKPWEDALLANYKYKPETFSFPGGKEDGALIINKESTTGCVKAFTPLSFGININEPAKCKLDYVRKDKFDDMSFFFGANSLFSYNHSQVMNLPGPSALKEGNLTIQNDGNYELFVRCQDANGNSNTQNFVFKYCVEKGPDMTPPVVVSTNLLNNMPIQYNQETVELEVYTNEPSDCKWTYENDKDYNEMENAMSCSSSILEMNAQMLYKCSTTLNGLKNLQNNKFYFRCKDQPGKAEGDRNTITKGYEFTLIGTQPLVINSAEPDNETIKDSTSVVKVILEAETSAGYKEGKANCYFSETGKDDDYTLFLETDSYKHTQELHLAEGDYKYYIKCIDLGGNSDTTTISFKIDVDNEVPLVVRAYHDQTYLRLETNEDAKCVYGTDDCNYLFDDGISLTSTDKTNQYIDWDTQKNYYIKCKDEYGNQPAPDKCSIIVRAVKGFEGEGEKFK